ncbi:GNAT family N-acetyltransferase [Thermodesulforhabdus norvegica]|uniref:Acetyltransferase (GNAT) family protein n=1 Tax=Thermodesulforhabdus norvegica TaxID=39841 RepID=A0A1I4UD79_9BACT|nr:GNAT family N-acetyltransferase [Thermodesulforhabdus norvegica]SFM86947.1 Acetyltransferase (GNAT) family protein [Thermodesulforhabdus norvegica]
MKGLIRLRKTVEPSDLDRVKEITSSTGVFNDEEVAVACELLEECLQKAEKSGYFFIFAYWNTEVAGYVCYGPIMGTDHRFYLNWIAVHKQYQEKGVGKCLLKAAEEDMRLRGAKKIFVETSSRTVYHRARRLYLRNGYKLDACVKDFYSKDDDRLIFSHTIFPDQPLSV